MMNTTTTTISTIDALKHAISYHNEATAIMSTGKYYDTTRQTKATSALTKVLRICQTIIGNHDDGPSLPSSSGKIVQALLERCMNNQEDMHESEVFPRCRSTTNGMTTTSSTANNESSTASSGSPQIGSRNRGSTLPPPQHETEQHTSAISKNHDDDEGACGFLYSKPIRIPPTIYDSPVLLTCGVSNICMFLSCTATFNLALIHQVLAQDQSTEELRKRSKGLLAKATRLYEICLTLSSEDTNQQDQESQYRDASIFDLATSNNLGMALEQLNESEKAQEYFTLALSTLMCLICQTTAPGRASVMGQSILPCPSDIDGFIRTASRIMSHEKAAAAA